MDIVYILGTGSQHQDLELKYSVRSVLKNATGYRNIVLIGAEPRCKLDCDVFHFIPMQDPGTQPQFNQRAKMLAACNNQFISDPFLLVHDDHFFLQTVDVRRLPLYHQGSLPAAIEWRSENGENPFLRTLINTERVLREEGLGVRDFGGHRPMPVFKRLMRGALLNFDWSHPDAYEFKSLYGNLSGLSSTLLSECLIDYPVTLEQIRALPVGKPFFAVSDAAITSGLLAFLEQEFPSFS